METPGHDRVRELFGRLVSAPPEERKALLDAEDEAVRREVESLLSGDGHAVSRLDELDHPRHAVGAPARVDRFELGARLGGGGMGVVYEAKDTRLGRSVAVKILHRGMTFDRHARARFEREARAASRLAHRNICAIHEFGETDDGEPYLVMPLYRGETLRERIQRGQLEVDEVLTIALQVAHGLSEAHRREVIHRDVKPGNILLTEEGDVVILDFGLAMMADVSHITRDGSTMGTVAYMSPEQVAGDEVDERTDLWSLGVVIYEMLTGVRPFRGDHDRALIHNIRYEKPVAPSTLREGIPEELDALVGGMLDKDPAARLQAPEVVLGRLAERRGTPELVEIRRRHGKRQRRRTLVRVGVAVAAIWAVVAGAWALRELLSDGPPDRSFDGRVVIGTFTAHGSASGDLAAELVPLLRARLDGVGALAAVAGASEGSDASVVVDGDVTQKGDLISVIANTKFRDLASTVSEENIRGDAALPAALDRLALHILGEILEFSGDHEGAAAARSTDVLPALRAHLAGRIATSEGRTGEGVDYQIEAVTLDTTFALAWFWMERALSAFGASHELDVGPEMERRLESLQLAGLRVGRTATSWTFSMSETIRYALAAAHRHSHRLPDRYRQLIEASNSSDAEALKIIQILCNRYPDDPELLWRRASLSATVEGRFREAWRDLERAAALDRDDSRPIARLLHMATVSRDLNAVDSLMAEYVRRGREPTDTRAYGDQVMLQVLEANEDELPALLTELEDVDWAQVQWASDVLAAIGRCDLAEPVATVITRRADWRREFGYRTIARCSAARGRLTETARTVLAVDYTFGDQLDAMVAMVSLFPFHADSSLTSFVMRAVETWDYANRPIRFAAGLDKHGAAIRTFYRAMLDLHEGTMPGDEILASFRRTDPVEGGLRNTLLAYTSAARNDHAAAIRFLDQDTAVLNYPYGGWLRAELHMQAGRYDVALGQYYGLLATAMTYLNEWLDSVVLMRIAQCYDGLGDAEMAAEYYRRFLMYWKDAEPAYQYLGRRAAARVEALERTSS